MDWKTTKIFIIPVGIIVACILFTIFKEKNNFSNSNISQNKNFTWGSSQVFLDKNISSTKNQNLEKINVLINNQNVNLEVAKTFSQREIGLMNRSSLEENSGMLFVFEQPQKLGFWMKNTLIPLDIIFLDQNFNILNIENATPQPGVADKDLKNYFSNWAAQYVIELASWESQILGLQHWQKINLPINI